MQPGNISGDNSHSIVSIHPVEGWKPVSQIQPTTTILRLSGLCPGQSV